MPETTNHPALSGDVSGDPLVFPETKLQTLDRRVGKDRLFFDKTQFAKSVDDWNGVPVIFQKDGIHPADFAKVAADPETAAAEIGGRVVGSVSHPRIVIPGGPRLMAQLDIDSDEDGTIRRLWNQGLLFPSTAFSAQSDGDRITAPPVPNHVLLFPSQTDTVQPGDYGAFVNTMEILPTMDQITPESIESTLPNFFNRVKEAVDEILAGYSPKGPEPDPENYAEVAEDLAEKTAELETLKAQLETLTKAYEKERSDREEELNGLKSELTALRGRQADAQFNTILNAIPKGMKATESQVAALRKKFDSDGGTDILLEALTHTAIAGITEPAGEPFVDSDRDVPFETVGNLNHPRKRSD
ncbi:MAG TPA: hypothetical protein O0X27_04125 [Methanocorpusculum sp.]|nr:hypothetical protein [Methanocorpusculum sp.]